MTTLVKITIGLLIALFLSSCAFDINFGEGKKGNGIVAEDRREITDEFTEVSVQEGLHVYVTQADEFKILVEADENIIDLIGTDIKNGKLKVHAIENIGRATKKVYVSLPAVTALKGSSGAQLTTENKIKADKLEVDASSGALVSLEVEASELDIDASSGANINIAGDTDRSYVDASSGANIKAKELESKVCTVDASSGANISVNVSESLMADASSGANISYSGEASVQKKKSFSGIVHKD